MDDARVWQMEESLWTGSAAHYRELIDAACLMVLPEPPHVLPGQAAIAAVSNTPRWAKVVLSQQHITRPQDGLIVLAYHAQAHQAGGEKAYQAHCTSTYRRLAHAVWRVVQHQQTPPLVRPV